MFPVYLLQTQPPKVRTFLDSIKRNSIASEQAYLNALRHFDRFLARSSRLTSPKNLETIISQLQTHQLNVYGLLDQFVTYLVELNLSNTSVILYITAVRSYLSYYDIDIVSSKFKHKVKMPKHYRARVRKEFSKTKTAMDVYISKEATSYLQDLIKWKYRNKLQEPDDLVFSVYFKKDAKPTEIYVRLQFEFEKLLKVAGMDQRRTIPRGIR
jgi:hypothetical protein